MRESPLCLSVCSVLLTTLGPAAAAPVLPADRAAAVAITEDALRAHVRFLADDQLGGRQPGSAGDRLARSYLAAQFEALGLLPAGDAMEGRPSYFQAVQLVGIRSRITAPPQFRGVATTVPVSAVVPQNEIVVVTGEQAAASQIQDAELVFVGYGITAPEYQWDDYKGADLHGKVLLMMNNDPESDPKLFAGKTRLYYGRWDYKYLEAARHGAAGALIIHTTPSAGYPWTVVRASWDGENFEAPEQVHEPALRLKVRGWLTEDASRRVTQVGGQDLDQLRKAAEKRDFHPVPLAVRLSVKLQNELRRLSSANVLGVLAGSDAKLRKESVVYTAHHDHLGTKADAKGADKIWNGALDNASGVSALLGIARAMTLGPAPRRSVLFAAVAGEEAGLIGSEFLVLHPPKEAGTPIADINIDGINIFGRSNQVVQIGRGKSSLDGVVDALAAAQGRKAIPDPMPDRGSFYRSDQFNYARAGVPSIYLGPPMDLLGPGGKVLAGAGRARVEQFIQRDYHQPSDELRDDWNFAGAVEDARLLYLAGLRIANAPGRPTFHKADEFARKPLPAP